MLTTRFWDSTAVLLCALLLQNCQSSSVAIAEKEPAASSPSVSAMRRRAPSEPLTVRSLAFPSASLAAPVTPSRFSKTLTNEEGLSAAPSTCSLGPVVRHALATVSNSLKAPYNLPAATILRASHAVPLSKKPGHASSPDRPRVYLPQVKRVLGGIPGEAEDSKPPAKQAPSDPNDELARKKARDGEGWEHKYIRRDVLNMLLAMAGSEPAKAIQFLDVLLVAAQDKHCRQQALEALGKVAQASPNMFSACLPSLRAAARAGDKAVRLLALRTLGEVEWKYYFGEVGAIPDLPSDMVTILDSACPIWPGRKVKDTHLLVLIPAAVDGAPFTLNLLGEELVQRPKNGGHRTKYEYYGDDTKAQFGEKSPDRSYWLLMTRAVLEGSRGRVYAAQRALVVRYASSDGLPYEIPGALEAATAILMHYVCTGERLFGDSPWTYTRCQELIGSKYPVVVGCFESSGLDVNVDFSHCGSYDCLGSAGCRKF